MNQFGRIILGLVVTMCFVAIDEVVRSNVRAQIKKRIFGATSADEEVYTHSSCCGGGCRTSL